MTASDKKVKTVLIASISVYVFALLLELLTVHFLNYISVLNSITSFLLICYWIRKQFRITTHYFELGEISIVGFEIIFFSFSVYQTIVSTSNAWIETFRYCIFGMHFMTLIMFLVFMMTFKIKKLF